MGWKNISFGYYIHLIDEDKVYIVVLNYMNWWDTLECLEAILRIEYTNYQIIVLDNNSPNESMNFIKLWINNELSPNIKQKKTITYNLSFPPINKTLEYICYDFTKSTNQQKVIKTFEQDSAQKIKATTINPLILIQNSENKGYAVGNNIAIDLILSKNDAEYVMILNPDTILTKDAIKNLVSLAKDNPKTIIGSVIKDYYNPDKIRTYGGCIINKKTASVKNITELNRIKQKWFLKKEHLLTMGCNPLLDYISGNSLFTHINSFKEIGLIPDEYFLFWEETDWCTQAKLKGYKFEVCLESVVFDKEASSVGRGYFAEYYFMLSSLKYFKKHYPQNLKYIVFFHLLRLLKRFLKKDYEKAKALKDALRDFFD